MSDDWDSYSRASAVPLAWISFDRGLGQEIEHIVPRTCLKLHVSLRAPSPAGMPGKAEFDALNRIEDALVPFVEERGGTYAGRLTAQGRRTFVCYAEIQQQDMDTWCREIAGALGYEMTAERRHDPKRQTYWQDLYPTPDDDSLIQDRKVFEALSSSGDDGSRPRRIDHWACFPRGNAAEAFAGWIVRHGYALDAVTSTHEAANPFHVQFHRVDTPSIGEFTTANIHLRRMARQWNGVYDGWETIVVKDAR